MRKLYHLSIDMSVGFIGDKGVEQVLFTKVLAYNLVLLGYIFEVSFNMFSPMDYQKMYSPYTNV